MTEVPFHALGAVLEDSDGVHTLALPDQEPVVLDDVALAIWELCDGETSVEEMAHAAAAVFDAEEVTLRNDINNALSVLTAQNLVLWRMITPVGPGEGTVA